MQPPIEEPKDPPEKGDQFHAVMRALKCIDELALHRGWNRKNLLSSFFAQNGIIFDDEGQQEIIRALEKTRVSKIPLPVEEFTALREYVPNIVSSELFIEWAELSAKEEGLGGFVALGLIDEEKAQKIAQEKILENIKNGQSFPPREYFDFAGEDFLKKEVKEAARGSALISLGVGNIPSEEILSVIDEGFLKTEEAREAAREGFYWKWQHDNEEASLGLAKEFDLYDRIYNDDQLVAVVKKRLLDDASYGVFYPPSYDEVVGLQADMARLVSRENWEKLNAKEYIDAVKVKLISVLSDAPGEVFSSIANIKDAKVRKEFFEDKRVMEVVKAKPEKCIQFFCSSFEGKEGVMEMLIEKFRLFHRLPETEKLQPHTNNTKYDPWLTDAAPLLEGATQEGTISLYEKEDGDIFYDYVREFGMYNLPGIFEWYTAVSRAKNQEGKTWHEDISPVIAERFRTAIGKNISDFETKGLCVNAMKEFRLRIQNKLLDDEVPQELLDERNIYAKELFKNLCGTTQWGRGDSVSDLLRTLTEAQQENPEAFMKPEWAQEETIAVPLRKRRESNPETEKHREEEIMKRWNNKAVQETIAGYKESYREATDIDDVNSWFQGKIESGIVALEADAASISARIASASEAEKKHLLIQKDKKQNRLDLFREDIGKAIMIGQSTEFSYEDALDFLAQNSGVPKYKEALTVLSAHQMLEIMPAAQRDSIREALLPRESTRENAEDAKREIDLWAGHIRDYVNEHYLNDAQIGAEVNEERAEEHSGHKPLSAGAFKALRSAWRVNEKDIAKNPVIDAAGRIEKIEEGKGASEKKINISLVPARGVWRVFSGDVGDACYTSQHKELASGEYENLTAFLYVVDRGTKNERIRGSVLAIETKHAETGEGVWTIRANNPQEGLLSVVDDSSFMEGVMGYFTKKAEEHGVHHVGVPLDGASQSSSNRGRVSAWYKERFSASPRMPLDEGDPSNSFNGYKNWDSKGTHPVVDIMSQSSETQKQTP